MSSSPTVIASDHEPSGLEISKSTVPQTHAQPFTTILNKSVRNVFLSALEDFDELSSPDITIPQGVLHDIHNVLISRLQTTVDEVFDLFPHIDEHQKPDEDGANSVIHYKYCFDVTWIEPGSRLATNEVGLMSLMGRLLAEYVFKQDLPFNFHFPKQDNDTRAVLLSKGMSCFLSFAVPSSRS